MAQQLRQRMLFVCGNCSEFWSANATAETLERLDEQARHLQRTRPACPKCGAKPPRWSFERHPVGEVRSP